MEPKMPSSLTIRCPDDWHVHFRDGAMLRAVVPFTAAQFARAIVMPNLVPPVTTVEAALAYRERVRAAIPAGLSFEPLMTCYLTDGADPAELARGYSDRVWQAAKLYPAHATTNSHFGVTSIDTIAPALEAMSRVGMPLLVHGEVTDPQVDIFDREAVFLERVLDPILRRHAGLKVVMEHVTTEDGVAFVRAHQSEKPPRLAATITPHHLVINRNAIFAGGIRPHFYCLPVAKRERHRLALRQAATSGEACFFLGTDTAPHPVHLKENACGCAGVFNAPTAMQVYAQVFAEENALDRLEAFASVNGPAFYGLPLNETYLALERTPSAAPERIAVEGDVGAVVVFRGGEELAWRASRQASARSQPARQAAASAARGALQA
jgi:dihydroorotase